MFKITRSRRIIALIGIAVVLGTIYVVSARVRQARYDLAEVKCHNQLRSLGQAVFLYANDNQGRFPDRLEDLMATQGITPEVFICPGSDDTPAPGGSMEELVGSMQTGGSPDGVDAPQQAGRHCSYIYSGKGMGMMSSKVPGTVLMTEPLSNHGGLARHVLFTDGHVEFISRDGKAIAVPAHPWRK